MVSAVLFITFFVLLVLNVPISVCLGLSSAAAILYSGTSLTIVATNIYSGISKFLLLAIPFFVLSGNIMAKAGISTRLIRFVDTCVGHRKGGIANVCIIVACFFGAISGSGPATVAALGAVLIPAMIERGGFSAAFSTALMATSSSIAIVIPPSIAFVVYASITGVSIGDMFMAGIIPGILMGLALVVVVMLEVRRNHVVPSTVEKASAKERWNAFKDAFWGFLMPVIILGGIYGGIFTPTEAAAVSVVYGLFVGMIIYKEVKFKDLWEILIDSAKTTGGIMLIIGAATLFSYVCTVFGIAQAAQALLLEISGNKYIFLLIVNVIFLIAGCFVDANSAMYIFIPIMYPVATQLGIDPVHFGVIATVNLAIGQVTPPVGVNLFVACGIGNIPFAQLVKKIIPFLLVLLLLAPNFLPADFFLTRFLKAIGNTGIVILLVTVMAAIKVEGKPLLNFKVMVDSGVTWGIVLLLAFVQPLTIAMAAPGSGITDFLMQLLTPFFGESSSITFALFIGFAAVALTQVMNNGAVGVVLMPVIHSFCQTSGMAPELPLIMVVMGVHFAFLTPAASASAALLHGNEWCNTKAIWKSSPLAILGAYAATAIVTLLLGSLLYS